jgi:hypothetical protein
MFYTIADVIAKRPPSSYVASIVSLAKQCGEGDTDFPLVLRAWRNLEMPLREHIDEPDEKMTIADFISVLNKKQTNWFDKFAGMAPHRTPTQAAGWNTPRGGFCGRFPQAAWSRTPRFSYGPRNYESGYHPSPNYFPGPSFPAPPQRGFPQRFPAGPGRAYPANNGNTYGQPPRWPQRQQFREQQAQDWSNNDQKANGNQRLLVLPPTPQNRFNNPRPQPNYPRFAQNRVRAYHGEQTDDSCGYNGENEYNEYPTGETELEFPEYGEEPPSYDDPEYQD